MICPREDATNLVEIESLNLCPSISDFGKNILFCLCLSLATTGLQENVLIADSNTGNLSVNLSC